MIEIKGLYKSFEDTPVIQGVDLKVEKGDVIAIIGPSGSGKTTMLRIMNFLAKADSGHMIFDDEEFDLTKMHKKDIARIRKKTAFVFQNYNLFRNKNALENVTLGLTVGRKMDKKSANEIGMKMLEKVGLADRSKHYPNELSGGQQQRVAIARAIASNPEVIYFDEPTSALDPELIGEVLNVMKALADEGMTMVVVTHELNFARNVANKIIFMDQGKAVMSSSAKDFFENQTNPRINSFINSLSHNIEETDAN